MAEAHDRDGRRAITHARARKEPRCQDTNRSFRRGNRTSSEIFRRSHRPTPSGTRNRRGSVSIRVAINGLGRIGRAIRFVLLSAPSKDEDIATVVRGVNAAGSASAIVSCASCATNCITPIVEVVGRRIGFRKAAMTTVHAYTSSQSVVDGPSKRFRRGRAAGANLVPGTTGAALATTRALPEYPGRFDGVAVRTPIPLVRLPMSPSSPREARASRRSTGSSSRRPQRSATWACWGYPAMHSFRPTSSATRARFGRRPRADQGHRR